MRSKHQPKGKRDLGRSRMQWGNMLNFNTRRVLTPLIFKHIQFGILIGA
jgi:hypothetical protein